MQVTEAGKEGGKAGLWEKNGNSVSVQYSWELLGVFESLGSNEEWGPSGKAKINQKGETEKVL